MFISLIGISPWSNGVDSGKSFAYRQFAAEDIENRKYESAIFNLEKALEYEENSEDRKLLGGCYGSIGDNEKAVTELERSLELKYDIGIATNLGKFYLLKGEGDKALDKFKKVIDLAPNNPASFNNMGSAYSKIGEFEKAECYYQLAVDKCVQTGFESDLVLFNTAINYYDLYKKSKDRNYLLSSLYYHFLADYSGNEAALDNAEQLYGMIIKKDKKDWTKLDGLNFIIIQVKSIDSYLDVIKREKERKNLILKLE